MTEPGGGSHDDVVALIERGNAVMVQALEEMRRRPTTDELGELRGRVAALEKTINSFNGGLALRVDRIENRAGSMAWDELVKIAGLVSVLLGGLIGLVWLMIRAGPA